MDYLVHHSVHAAAEQTPDKEALVQKSRRLSYRDVDREIERIANGLRLQGCRPGDRVGIFLRPSIDQALAIYAISRAGCVFVPIHHSLFPRQVAHIIDDCEMAGLIGSPALIAPAQSELRGCASLRFVIFDEGSEASPELAVGCHSLAELPQPPTSSPPGEAATGEDLAAILYTSGSTGKPKGVMLSHANLLAGARIVSAYLELDAADRILAALPFSFDAGLNQLTTAFMQGGTLVVLDFLLANEIPRVLLQEKITGLAGVPTLWSLIAHNRAFATGSFPDLRYITNTGGVLPQDVLSKLRAVLPDTEIYLMYGLTEAFRSTYLPPGELSRRPTSMGIAIPDTEILVIDDSGRRCGPGEIGELVHDGPTVSLGYWGDPTLTSKVFRPHPFPDRDGPDRVVCYSGDLVKMDEDGFLYFVGRRDKQIKSSGFRISPTEVEEVLMASGTIRAAAAIGLPDERLGQKIKAFVVPVGDPSVVPPDLEDYCRSNMPAYMVPQTFEAIDALPTTPHGKIDYEALRSFAASTPDDRDAGKS